MGQSSDEPINAGIAANVFSKREIEAYVSRVGVQDRRQLALGVSHRGWSNFGVETSKSEKLPRHRDLPLQPSSAVGLQLADLRAVDVPAAC